MSYLLKALQKAEQERQQQTHSDHPATQVVAIESKLPASLLIIVSLLVLATIWQMWPKTAVINEDAIDVVNSVEQPSNINAKQESVIQIKQDSISSTVVSAGVSQTQESQQPAPIKTLTDLTSAELARIPSLELASHIYSSAADYRSVVINGQTYNQGMLIKAGVVLEEITQTGIVINVKGQRVELPKGISWIASQNVE